MKLKLPAGLLAIVAVVAATGVSGVIAYPTRSPCVQSYGGFSGNPNHDTLGPDGALWAAEGQQDLVARFDPNTKKVTEEIKVPPHTMLHDLFTGPDGYLWYTGNNNAVGKINIHTRQVTSYPGLRGAGNPHIWFAPDGNYYVSEVLAGRLAKLNPKTGRITDSQYNLPPDSGIHAFAQLPDGSTWWGLGNTDQLAHFNLKEHRFDRFVQLRPNSGPHWLLYVPKDDSVWIALEYANQMAQFNLRTGAVTYFTTPLHRAAKSLFTGFRPFPYLTQMLLDASGQNIWIATLAGSQLLRLNVNTHKITAVTCGLDPGLFAATIVFTRDSKGRLWVTEPFNKKLGLIVK